MASDLPLLSEKLLAAKGGDRETLLELFLAVEANEDDKRRIQNAMERVEAGTLQMRDILHSRHLEETTCFRALIRQDATAAIQLVEAKLPGWNWHIGTLVVPQVLARPYGAYLGDFRPHPKEFRADAPTPALALLCAFVAAMGEK